MARMSSRMALRDPKRTRTAILDAAQDEFAAKGLFGARVNEVAKKARANKRMIYHYFGSKAGL
jgi:AcrR family transcriptional regulator